MIKPLRTKLEYQNLIACHLVLLIGLMLASSTQAQSTSFSYQGKLDESGAAANGNYDFEFRLYDQAANGTQLGPTISATGVAVSDGYFTVELDFGPEFTGDARFLEIAVSNAGGGLTVLTPRQEVLAAPYSMHAQSVAHGAVDTPALANNAVTGAKIDDAAVAVTHIDVDQIQTRVTGTCAQGSSIRSIGPGGEVTCEPDDDSGGDITGVTAGVGLSGGGLSGDVSVAADLAVVQARTDCRQCILVRNLRGFDRDPVRRHDIDHRASCGWRRFLPVEPDFHRRRSQRE